MNAVDLMADLNDKLIQSFKKKLWNKMTVIYIEAIFKIKITSY